MTSAASRRVFVRMTKEQADLECKADALLKKPRNATENVVTQQIGPRKGRPRKDGREPFRLKEVVEVLEEYGLDPLAEIARILKEEPDALRANERVRVLESLLEYYTPKLKSVDHKGSVDVRQRLTDDQLKAIAAEVLLAQK